MVRGTPRQSFRIDELFWKKFKKKCKSKGYTASSVLRAFIRQVNSGKISVDSVSPTKSQRGEKLTSFYEEFELWLKKSRK